MAIGRTSQSTRRRSAALPSLPPGVIPAPRPGADPPLPPAATAPAPAPAPRRRTAQLLAVPAVVALGAAAAVLVSGQPGTPAPGGPAEAGVARSAEDVGFLRTVRQQPAFAVISDDSLVKIGHMLCTQLQRGANPDDIAMGSSAATLSVEDVSTAVGAAAGAYCPDQISRVGTVS